MFRVPAEGGTPEPLSRANAGQHRWSVGGDAIYFLWPGSDSLSVVSPEGGDERVVADLSDKRGKLGDSALATDGEYLYFTWEEDLGDVWVMDVVYE